MPAATPMRILRSIRRRGRCASSWDEHQQYRYKSRIRMTDNTKRFFDVPRGMAQLLLGVNVLVFMLCLILWGGLLERRVEALYFTLIYLCGLVFGGIVSNVTHPGPYLSVGASGA